MKGHIIFIVSVAFVVVLMLTGCAVPLVEETAAEPPTSYLATTSEDIELPSAVVTEGAVSDTPEEGTSAPTSEDGSDLDQTFQIVVLPDTQRYTSSPAFQELFTQQTEWIVDNLESEDIRFVTHLGDIVDKERTAVPWEEQWPVADAAISLLDGHAPYFCHLRES